MATKLETASVRRGSKQDLEAPAADNAVQHLEVGSEEEEDEHQHYSQRAPWLRAGTLRCSTAEPTLSALFD